MRTFRVWFDPMEWDRDQREWIGLAVFAARALGVDMLWEAHRENADVSLLRWNSEDEGPLTAGQYNDAQKLIQIDPVGCHGERELRQAVAHEVGHFLGLGHVPAPAIMAAHLGGDPDAIDPDLGVSLAPALVDYTENDRAEYLRVTAD